MLSDYVAAAMRRARFEVIEDDEPHYGEVPELSGVWASGATLQDCRENLSAAIEGWVLVRLSRGLEIPPLDGLEVTPKEMTFG